MVTNEAGKDECDFTNWSAHAFYFGDASVNSPEFIARHDLKNAVDDIFNGKQFLQVSEIGLPSEDVIVFAIKLCSMLNIPVFQQEPNVTFTPVGDDELFILPINDRIWIPNSDLPVKLLSVKVDVEANGTKRAVRGVPYEINNR